MATRSSSERSGKIRKFILDHVDDVPGGISSAVSRKFRISRQAAHRYIRGLITQGLVGEAGRTRDKVYTIKPIVDVDLALKLAPGLNEDVVWRRDILPHFQNIPANVRAICEYGLTEMLNNAIDHSEGRTARIRFTIAGKRIELSVSDDGVGIFEKIRKDLRLDHPRLAILELAKGKFTTDPRHHTGEGIFFTSRTFDGFSIHSGGLYFHHTESKGDWLIEDRTPATGTLVTMTLGLDSTRELQRVFDAFSGKEYNFSRTHIPVNLARIGTENLVSRSQAKRLLSRFDRFEEIVLDFKDVESIGQAFADELFRVFANEHPRIRLRWINTNGVVGKMIRRVRAGR